jgi:hypothetical protein
MPPLPKVSLHRWGPGRFQCMGRLSLYKPINMPYNFVLHRRPSPAMYFSHNRHDKGKAPCISSLAYARMRLGLPF